METQDLSELKPQDVVVAYQLIEQLCERGNNAAEWRNFLGSELCRIIGAEAIFSYLMKFALDPGDIAPQTLIMIAVGGNEQWEEYLARGDLRDNPVTPFIMERFGTDFTCSRQDWINDQTWYASEHVKTLVLGSGWDHAIYSQVGIIRPGVVDGIGITRRVGEPAFSPREIALVRFIHQEMARLWRKHDPLDTHTLPPRQREVLEGIRQGESRKAIAEKMEVSDHTVHTYERALFTRAKVAGRMELQALLNKLVRPALLP